MALATATLRTTITPPLSVSTDDLLSGSSAGGGSDGGGASASAPGGWSAKHLLFALLRPAWSLETPLGTSKGAPGGDPGDTWMWAMPAAVVGLVAVVGFAVYGVVRLVRRG